MSVLYIQEQGAYLEKRGNRILVMKNHQRLLDIPSANVENIALLGNIQITTQLLQHLMENGVDVSFFSYGGNYLGHLCAERSRNIFLRLSQYEYYQDKNQRLAMAQLIVSNKVQNQKRLIEHFRWNGTQYDWKEDVCRLNEQQSQLEQLLTVEKVMGTEGFCSKVYFGAYGKMFRCRCKFSGRNRRPPRDPINVILSLGYTFLTREVGSALEAESFEMYLGFLHGVRYGRKSLALDMVEEFRQPVIDRLTLRLFNKGMLSEYDFETEGDAVSLSKEGFQTFCREYECWMQDKTFADREMCFRSRIKQQASRLKQAILQSGKYAPYEWNPGKGEDTCM